MTDQPRKYRPSNGTEGDIFFSSFCSKCVLTRLDSPRCDILARTLFLDKADPDYPAEWTYDAQGQPTCTAFRFDDGSDPTPEPTRCPVTKDLFE